MDVKQKGNVSRNCARGYKNFIVGVVIVKLGSFKEANVLKRDEGEDNKTEVDVKEK